MHDTTRTSVDLCGWTQRWPQYESLPGQRELFSECENEPSNGGRIYSSQQSALFDTGKDLPGATERDQAIFWDVT